MLPPAGKSQELESRFQVRFPGIDFHCQSALFFSLVLIIILALYSHGSGLLDPFLLTRSLSVPSVTPWSAYTRSSPPSPSIVSLQHYLYLRTLLFCLFTSPFNSYCLWLSANQVPFGSVCYALVGLHWELSSFLLNLFLHPVPLSSHRLFCS